MSGADGNRDGSAAGASPADRTERFRKRRNRDDGLAAAGRTGCVGLHAEPELDRRGDTVAMMTNTR